MTSALQTVVTCTLVVSVGFWVGVSAVRPISMDAQGFQRCANEDGFCACDGKVVYGLGNTTWLEGVYGYCRGGTPDLDCTLNASGAIGIECSNDEFGDPYVDETKSCFCKRLVATESPSSSSSSSSSSSPSRIPTESPSSMPTQLPTVYDRQLVGFVFPGAPAKYHIGSVDKSIKSCTIIAQSLNDCFQTNFVCAMMTSTESSRAAMFSDVCDNDIKPLSTFVPSLWCKNNEVLVRDVDDATKLNSLVTLSKPQDPRNNDRRDECWITQCGCGDVDACYEDIKYTRWFVNKTKCESSGRLFCANMNVGVVYTCAITHAPSSSPTYYRPDLVATPTFKTPATIFLSVEDGRLTSCAIIADNLNQCYDTNFYCDVKHDGGVAFAQLLSKDCGADVTKLDDMMGTPNAFWCGHTSYAGDCEVCNDDNTTTVISVNNTIGTTTLMTADGGLCYGGNFEPASKGNCGVMITTTTETSLVSALLYASATAKSGVRSECWDETCGCPVNEEVTVETTTPSCYRAIKNNRWLDIDNKAECVSLHDTNSNSNNNTNNTNTTNTNTNTKSMSTSTDAPADTTTASSARRTTWCKSVNTGPRYACAWKSSSPTTKPSRFPTTTPTASPTNTCHGVPDNQHCYYNDKSACKLGTMRALCPVLCNTCEPTAAPSTSAPTTAPIPSLSPTLSPSPKKLIDQLQQLLNKIANGEIKAKDAYRVLQIATTLMKQYVVTNDPAGEKAIELMHSIGLATAKLLSSNEAAQAVSDDGSVTLTCVHASADAEITWPMFSEDFTGNSDGCFQNSNKDNSSTCKLPSTTEYIKLPSAKAARQGSNSSSVYVYFVVFNNNTLFQGNTTQTASATIISANVDGLSEFAKGAKLTYQLKLPANESVATNEEGEGPCVWWQQSKSRWNSSGCGVVSTEVDALDASIRVVCECTHLTSFAVLMDTSGASVQKLELGIFTLVCVGISIICFSLVIAIYSCYSSLRTPAKRILLHLCIAYNLALVFFVVSATTEWSGLAGRGCEIIGVCLHYTLLCTFVWMLVEGHFLYQSFVHVFTSQGVDQWVRMKMYAGFAYLFPLVFVLVAFAVPNAYVRDDGVCFLSNDNETFHATWLFVGPALAVIGVNIVVLIAIVKVIWGLAPTSSYGRTRTGENVKRVKQAFRVSFTFVSIMGITWGFGLLLYIVNDIAFLYVYSVFNALAGLWIFLFHVVRDPDVRNRLSRRRSSSSQSPVGRGVFRRDKGNDWRTSTETTSTNDEGGQDSVNQTTHFYPTPLMRTVENPTLAVELRATAATTTTTTTATSTSTSTSPPSPDPFDAKELYTETDDTTFERRPYEYTHNSDTPISPTYVYESNNGFSLNNFNAGTSADDAQYDADMSKAINNNNNNNINNNNGNSSSNNNNNSNNNNDDDDDNNHFGFSYASPADEGVYDVKQTNASIENGSGGGVGGGGGDDGYYAAPKPFDYEEVPTQQQQQQQQQGGNYATPNPFEYEELPTTTQPQQQQHQQQQQQQQQQLQRRQQQQQQLPPDGLYSITVAEEDTNRPSVVIASKQTQLPVSAHSYATATSIDFDVGAKPTITRPSQQVRVPVSSHTYSDAAPL